MQTVKNTKIKTYSKVRELESADTVDLVYDVMDFQRAQTISNGTKISSQKGSRRIVDNARNKFAHETVDYSSFKVIKIEQGQTIDPRIVEQQQVKKEQDLETEALALLADLGIDWSDDDSDDEDDDQVDEQPETQADDQDEQMPSELDNLLTDILDNNSDEENQHEYRLEIQQINRAESGFPRLGDRKYVTFYSDVNNAISAANELLKEIDPTDCWGAELWNQSMKYRFEYKWDVSNKYEQASQYSWLDWTGKQL